MITETPKTPRKIGRHDAITITKLIVWLSSSENQARVAAMTPDAVKRAFDSECQCNVAIHSLKQVAGELNIAMRRKRKLKVKSEWKRDRLMVVMKIMSQFAADIERATGMEPGTIGRESGARDVLNRLISKQGVSTAAEGLSE